VATYTRGPDLSGSLEGAGGIGGLLSMRRGTQDTAFFADAGGNVTALVNANQQVVGRYLYDPYGGLIGMSGPMSEVNRYRFSSKEVDPTSGLYSFGYRFYAAEFQRWLNRDPIEEDGGLNLYAAMGNDPVTNFDPYGLDWQDYIPAWVDPAGDFFAGLGDSLTFSVSRRIRDANSDFYQTDKDSGAYFGGELTSFGFGAGRLAYAGAAKSLCLIKGANALDRARKISDARNKLKAIFRLGAFPNYRNMPWADVLRRYGNDPARIIGAARRTNPFFNRAGAGAVGGSIINIGTHDGDGPK